MFIEYDSPSGTDAQGNPQRSRKRQSFGSKAELRKSARNMGKEYVTEKNKKIDEKKFYNVDCRCKKECPQKISEAARKNLFKKFWEIGSFSGQNIYMCGLVTQISPQMRRPRDFSRSQKSTTNYYRLQFEKNSVKVCKKYFLNTFQISDGRLGRALKKLSMGQQPGMDKRGHHIPNHKTPDDQMKIVCDHILSFPSYQSHYTRTQNPNRKFLASNLNIRLMYNLYREHCQNLNLTSVTESIYRRTFNTKFNLHFHSPSTDTCAKCDAFKIKILALEGNEEEKEQLKVQHEVHMRKAEAARNSLRQDTKKAKEDQSFYVMTFDLEKALPFPKLTTSVAYYKRNMYVYNLGCHEMSTDLGFMYVWDETIASRGSQEISSCVQKHLQERATTLKHVVLYSDTCTGQNRNLNFVLMLMKLVDSDNNSIENIDFKFMVSGHSFLPNDSDFGSIELYAKQKSIYVPEDWYDIIKKSRRNKTFHVTKMSRCDFKSVTSLQQTITKRKKNTDNQPVSWLKMQWIRVVKADPYTMFYKETIQEEFPFSSINLKSNKRGRPSNLRCIGQENLYKAPRPVTQVKKKDMIDLLPYIPPIHHNYFQNLSIINADVPDEEEDEGPLQDYFPADEEY